MLVPLPCVSFGLSDSPLPFLLSVKGYWPPGPRALVPVMHYSASTSAS
jgi:hypothetical protein